MITSIDRRWLAAAALASAAFLCIAIWRLDLPGLYYDEALFIPPSAKLFDKCSLDAWVFLKFRCVPIILQPPYLGSLKAILYAPIFGFFGVNAVTIRLPGVLALLTTNLAFWWFWRPRIGEPLAFALLALMSVDAASIFHARVDWGPYVIQNACKLGMIGFVYAWIETRSSRCFALASCVAFIGIFDKLNFLWLMPAALVAIALVYPRETLLAFRDKLKINIGILAGSVVLGAIWLKKLIIPIIISRASPESFDISAQFHRVLGLMRDTLNSGAYSVLFGAPWTGFTWLSNVAFGSTLAGLALLPLRRLLRAKSEPAPLINRLAGYSCSLAIMNSILFLCMVATRETGGSHHAIFVSHLWQLQLVTSVGLGVALAKAAPKAIGAIATAVGWALLSLVLFLNLASAKLHLSSLDRRHPFAPAFSPAIYELSDLLETLDASAIISVDWGIHNSVMSLARNGRRGLYHDRWPTFNELGQGHLSAAKAITDLPGTGALVFVTRPAHNAVFSATISGFLGLVAPTGNCSRPPFRIEDAAGRPQYLVYQLDRSCLR